MSSRTKGLLHVHLAVFLWGFSGVFAKLIPLPAVVIVPLRLLMAASIIRVLLSISTGKREKRHPTSQKHAYVFLICGFLMAINIFAYYQAVQVSTVAIGALSAGIFPVFVTLLEPIYFREKLRAVDLVLAILAFTGLVIMTPKIDLHSSATQGIFWGVAAAVAFSNLTVLNRKYVQHYSSLAICYYQDLLAGIILSPALFVCHYRLTMRSLVLIMVAAIFLGVIGETIFIKGMRHVKASTAGVIANLEPCYAILLAFFFLGEVPSLRTLIGGLLVLGTAVKAMSQQHASEIIQVPG